MKNTIDLLFKYLPIRISMLIHSLPEQLLKSVNEVRLRKNSPISLTCAGKNIMIGKNGLPCKAESAVQVTEDEFAECLSKLTESSLYSYDEYLKIGFIPLREGGRAGVCGKADPNGSFSEISSISLRLHRFLPDCALPLIRHFSQSGLQSTLVCSPPAMGKTTFLKSAACLLASGYILPPARVCIADERAELAIGLDGIGLLDVISLMPKPKAIEIFTRTMSPEVIICDEISAFDVEPLIESAASGICLIASAHCIDPSDLKRRGRMSRLLEGDMFPLCVILDNRNGYTCRIEKTEAFL